MLGCIWTASSEFGTYRICEQRRFRRACASAQSRQNLRCSLIQAVSEEEPSDRKPDPLWMAGHAQLKCVMTECSKTQIRLTRLICEFYQFHEISHLRWVEIKDVINMLMPFHDIYKLWPGYLYRLKMGTMKTCLWINRIDLASINILQPKIVMWCLIYSVWMESSNYKGV